eukprot:SAG31_NODE_3589_length_4093_cov_2.991487_1_plen_223_part_00
MPDVPVPFSSLLKQEGCVDGTTAWLLVLGGTTGLLHGIQFHYFQDYLLRFTRFERRTLVQIRDETPGVIDSSMRVTVGAMAVVTVMEIVLLYLDWNLSAVLVLGSGCLALYLINRVLKASWLPTPAGRMSIPFVCLAAAFVILATAWKQDTSIEISQQVVASNLVRILAKYALYYRSVNSHSRITTAGCCCFHHMLANSFWVQVWSLNLSSTVHPALHAKHS